MAAQFRDATPDDLETLVGLMRSLYAHDGAPFEDDRAPRAMAALLEAPELGRVWLVSDGEEVVGYAVLALGYSLECGGRDAFIDEIFIREDRRGRGLGRETLEFLTSRCRAMGIVAIHLAVKEDNLRAREVYLKAGFLDQGYRMMSKPLADAGVPRRAGH